MDQSKDILEIINHELLKKLTFQAFCEVNSGFLANGRPLLPSQMNKIEFKSPQKCTYFGTNAMIDMLDWLGREVHKEYFSEQFSDAKLVVGDISAPRGGCLSGLGGRRGHRSHTTGQDVDLGFLLVKGGKYSAGRFNQVFDAQTNWWLLKKLFQNPYACIQKIFLDRKLIQKLARFAKADPKWSDVKKIIKHVRGHRNHFHIRIGNAAGKPGCPSEPAFLDEEDVEEEEELLGLMTK
ncbi:MAG: penicillin-insensitive murein endopeptidase [Deltaproteobacteria bacterium]|nr:penicillin-insensitive murein endopeptidase [Deltaproteobacteria bacterium]